MLDRDKISNLERMIDVFISADKAENRLDENLIEDYISKARHLLPLSGPMRNSPLFTGMYSGSIRSEPPRGKAFLPIMNRKIGIATVRPTLIPNSGRDIKIT